MDGQVPMSKLKLATVWLDGCSGCHMSLLDIDERLVALAELVDLVYSPLVDAKTFPDDVDVTLVEGAVSTEADLHRIKLVRERTRVLVALGDCAVTSNVPGMRNAFGPAAVIQRAYVENAVLNEPARRPQFFVPALLPRVRPVHEVVRVDVHLPGCPPPADAIHETVVALLENRQPDVSALSRFGR